MYLTPNTKTDGKSGICGTYLLEIINPCWKTGNKIPKKKKQMGTKTADNPENLDHILIEILNPWKKRDKIQINI